MSYVKDIDLGWGEILKELSETDATSVKVGIQSTAGQVNSGKISMAHLGAIQEFGGDIKVGASEGTVYHKVFKNCNFARSGRFVKKSKSNFARNVSIGAHKISIPSRPFMREGLDKNKNAITDLSTDLAGKILEGKTSVNQALKLIGQKAEKGIKDNMSSGGFAPNAASTIKKKKSSTPLIDTGHLRQSITSVVE